MRNAHPAAAKPRHASQKYADFVCMSSCTDGYCWCRCYNLAVLLVSSLWVVLVLMPVVAPILLVAPGVVENDGGDVMMLNILQCCRSRW